jgi:hypothetical protein
MDGMVKLRKIRSLAVALTASAAASFALIAPAAQAGPLVASAPDCSTTGGDQVFAPWADLSYYAGAPGGSFEDGAAGWTLSGSSVASGNESYNVGGGGSHSLSLPSGSSATSATACVGINNPDIRFFAKNSGSPLSTLHVDVKFEDANGDVITLPVGVVAGGGSWQPTLQMPIVANLLPLLPGENTPVAFRFTPEGAGGSWKVDDVYVDPPRCC